MLPPYGTAPLFTVNDRVVVVGTIEGAPALAIVVAELGAGLGGGLPTDCLDGQAFPSGATCARRGGLVW